MKPEWEELADEVQRIAIPGGWLYRTRSWVELPSGSDEPNRGYWHTSGPVFVPDATVAPGVRALDKVSETVESIRALTMNDENATYADRLVAAALTDIVTILRTVRP